MLLQHQAHLGVPGEINAYEIGYIAFWSGEILGSLILGAR